MKELYTPCFFCNEVVRDRTFSNYIFTGGRRCVGHLHTSSGWFNRIEPPRTFSNHFIAEKRRCVEFFRMSSGWFDYTEPSLTASSQGNKYLVSSMCSGVVQPHRSSSNFIVEPLRTHAKELYTPCFLCDEVVREGSRRFDPPRTSV